MFGAGLTCSSPLKRAGSHYCGTPSACHRTSSPAAHLALWGQGQHPGRHYLLWMKSDLVKNLSPTKNVCDPNKNLFYPVKNLSDPTKMC